MKNRGAEIGHCKMVEDMMAIIVQYAQVIRLLQITQDNLKLLTVFFLNQIFRNLIGDEFFNPFLFQFLNQCRIIWRRNLIGSLGTSCGIGQTYCR